MGYILSKHSQSLQHNMETVVEAMMDSESRGIKRALNLPTCYMLAESFDAHSVIDLITPPNLNQARVNKCLIALVNRKIVQKDNSTVCAISGYYILHIMLTWQCRGLFCIDGKGCHK